MKRIPSLWWHWVAPPIKLSAGTCAYGVVHLRTMRHMWYTSTLTHTHTYIHTHTQYTCYHRVRGMNPRHVFCIHFAHTHTTVMNSPIHSFSLCLHAVSISVSLSICLSFPSSMTSSLFHLPPSPSPYLHRWEQVPIVEVRMVGHELTKKKRITLVHLPPHERHLLRRRRHTAETALADARAQIIPVEGERRLCVCVCVCVCGPVFLRVSDTQMRTPRSTPILHFISYDAVDRSVPGARLYSTRVCQRTKV